MKLLMAFFTKTFRFAAKPEFDFRSPRSLKRRPLRFPIFSGKRPNSTPLFMTKAFHGPKKSERRKKKIFEVKFSILLHKLTSVHFGLSFFAYLKRDQKNGHCVP